MARGYTPEKWASILKRVSEIGAAAAAKEAGVAYQSVLKWLRNSSADEPGEKSGKGLKSGQGESVEERIQSTLDKIKAAEEEVKIYTDSTNMLQLFSQSCFSFIRMRRTA